MQKENKALWKAKPLLTKLVGDNSWAPCGLMTAPDDRDALLFTDTVSFFNRPAPHHIAAENSAAPVVNGVPKTQENALTEPAQRGAPRGGPQLQGIPNLAENEDAEKNKDTGDRALDKETLPDAHANSNGEREPGGRPSATEDSSGPGQTNGAPVHGEENRDESAHADSVAGKPKAASSGDVEMAEAPAPAEPQEPSRPTAAPVLPPPNGHAEHGAAESVEELFIHPLFRLPAAAHPDRDLGLPEQEAEEVRRLLLLYVQKQEEICRGTKRLYEGLLKADRLRKTVWQWSKAEAHCGPNREMSDGEDWYDKEEWGLTEDLKKGEDEVEEDTAQTQKKTRNRK